MGERGAQSFPRTVWRDNQALSDDERLLVSEAAVALVHDGGTTAVMMATPADLEDLAIGFSLTEGLISSTAEIRSLEIVESELGFEARLWLAAERGAEIVARRRHMAGPTGCGLCGIDSLEAATRPTPAVIAELTLSADQIQAGLSAMRARQALNAQTRAAHAAAYWTPSEGLLALREDVGRHNALDKLVGALSRVTGLRGGRAGCVLLSSRISVEMVQKTAIIGTPILVAVSAPTSLAVRTAHDAGITLVGIARDDGFEVFTHPRRIVAA